MESYKFLYTNGCSFTNHLPQPDSDKWPYHLRNELNIPNYINDGQGASSNQGIFKRTAKFLTDGLSDFEGIHHNDILAVIQLSFPFRFEMPSPHTVRGWQSYLPNHQNSDQEDSDSNNLLGECKILSESNFRYSTARLTSFAEHECYEAWEFYMQASAISNLLRSCNIDHFIVNISYPRLGLTQPVTGRDFGNLSEVIKFDDNFINWLYDTENQSNLYELIKNLNIPPVAHDLPGYVISRDDIHFNGEANKLLAKSFSKQINQKLKEKT